MKKPFLNRSLSLFLALTLVLPVFPVGVVAAEIEAVSNEATGENASTTETTNTILEPNPLLEQYQQSINDILLKYLESTDLSSEEMQTVVDGMDWDTFQTARMEIRQLDAEISAAIDIGSIAEYEIDLLLDNNLLFQQFITALEKKSETDNPVSLLATEKEGSVTGTGGTIDYKGTYDSVTFWGSTTVYCDISTENNTIKATARRASLGSSKTNTIQLSISGGAAKYVTFDYAVSGGSWTLKCGDADLTGSSATHGPILVAANSTLSLTLTGTSTSTTTLTLSNFVLEDPPEAFNVTVQYDALGSVTTTGNAVIASGTTKENISFNDGIELTAAANSGTKFLGWINMADNRIISEEANITFKSDKDAVIQAVFASATTKAWFKVNGTHLFDNLSTAASNGTTVVLAHDGILEGSHTIPSGVTLLIPFDDENTVIKNDMENYILKQDISGHELYRKLTMASGASICVNGTLCIGSRAARQMVGQVGPYGAIYMNSGSSISIENGATMYAYGYIFPGASGAGTVTVQSGGTVYEDLMVMDYPGSASSTSDLYYDSSIFPMRAFTARNVEVSMTLVHGAKEYVFYHFYGTTAGYNGDYVLLIGEASESNPSPFSLGAGASLTKSYVNGKQIIVVNGDSSVNAIAIKIKSYVTVSSSDTSGFPLPSGFDVTFDNGTVTLGDNLIMTEGSKITIGKNAILETNGKNLYVLDSSDPGAYSATDVHGTTYSPVNSDAILDINGVLNAGSSFYTATNGACVTSSGGSGQVNITAAATATNSVTIKSGKSGASTINLVSAKLKNADGKTPAFTDTSSATEATTYSYIDGVWQNCKRLDIVATNIAVNAGLDVNFYVNAADMVEGQTYTAVVKKHFAETIPNVPNPVEEEYISTSWFTPSQNTSFRGFRFDDVSAKEMTDKIEARIYINYGTENQMQVSNTYTETIQNYAVRTLVSEDVKTSVGADKFAKLQTALIDMLNYGATAQLYFKYNEENLANVDTEDTAGIISDHSGRASAKFDFDSWADPRDTSAFSTSFAGSSVSAKNQFMFTFYFYMDDSSGKTATIKVNDKEFTTISGDSFYDRKPGELYGVDVTGMSIVDANLLMECTVTDDTTGEVIGKANDSVLGYAKRMYEKTSEKIYEEMMKFAYSASLYFGNTWANGGT